MILRALSIATAVLAAAPAYAEARFFAAIDDLPLAPGLVETSGGFAFEGAEGRIVDVRAAGAAAPDAVRGFYVETLPALGWSQNPTPESGPLEFLRGRERLSLSIAGVAGHARLEARLVTRPASMSAD